MTTQAPKNTKKLNNISETMLITVWARAVETNRNDGFLNDPVAQDVIKNIDYDFSVLESAKMSQVGCCIRGKVMDEQALAFIDKHPDAVVIQLGAGLDTRYQRLNCPNVTHWYDLDLPESIEIRQSLCPEHSNNTLLPMSLFDDAWMDTVIAHDKPVLIIIEGVLMYFDELQVKDFFNQLCQRFERATILFDMLTYVVKGKAKHHDALKKTKQYAEFKWSLLNSKDMEQWNDKIHLEEEIYMSDRAGKRMPLWMRLICKIPWMYKRFNQRMLRVEIGNIRG